ncbi:MAG TPA: beta-ketoacyl-ACP synthase III [Opitutaceae bacterium]|jgi:3-oxoacyl-[acyl-carrier-protein] synthase-3
MPAVSTVILGTGGYAPERILTNADLSRMVDTSDEWIVTRSGIRERRVAADGELASDMGVQAARAALEDAKISPADIDLVVVATMTPDMQMPATACFIQQKLGVSSSAACFDVNSACTGFVYALDTACALVGSGRYKKALVIGAEKMSSVLDWKDRTTCVLFGDGAGAVVIGASDEPGRGLLGTRLGSHGDGAHALCMPNGYITMKGREVYKSAIRVMDEAARDILEQHGLTAHQIGLVVPHQANLRIIESVAAYLKLPLDRFFINVDRYGNTSAASIPIALDEARRAGRIKVGDLTLLVAFGAGLTYGSALIRW